MKINIIIKNISLSNDSLKICKKYKILKKIANPQHGKNRH